MDSRDTQHREAPGTAGVARQAFTIDEFCEAHRISRSTFYDLARRGVGPRTFRINARVLVSIEAAAEWLRRMESESGQVTP